MNNSTITTPHSYNILLMKFHGLCLYNWCNLFNFNNSYWFCWQVGLSWFQNHITLQTNLTNLFSQNVFTQRDYLSITEVFKLKHIHLLSFYHKLPVNWSIVLNNILYTSFCRMTSKEIVSGRHLGCIKSEVKVTWQ